MLPLGGATVNKRPEQEAREVIDAPAPTNPDTRKSTEEGLEQDFNSLDAQREAGEVEGACAGRRSSR